MTDDAETTPVPEAQVLVENTGAASLAQDPDDVSPVRVPGVSVREAQQADVAPDEAPVTLTETKVQEAADQAEKALELAQRLGMADYSPRIDAGALRQLIYGARMWRRTKRDNDALVRAIDQMLALKEKSDD